MRQSSSTRRSLSEQTYRYTTGQPPPSQGGPIDALGTPATIVAGLPLLVLLGGMLYAAPGLAAFIAAMAGLATAPVVVPFLVVRLVTAVLEQRPPSRQPTPSIGEPALNPEPDQNDD